MQQLNVSLDQTIVKRMPMYRKESRTIYTSLKFSTVFLLLLFLVLSQFNVQAQKMEQKSNNNPPPAMPEDISPLLIGERIPAIMLPDKDGKMFDLNKSVAEKPAILVFYRGGWCPFCTKQLSGLQGIKPALDKKGFQIIAISTDMPDLLKNSSDKEQLGYTLLSDAELDITKKFGIAFKAPHQYTPILSKSTGGKDKDYLLPVPSVFIVDKEGIIRFEYINPDFKQRISSSLLLAVADALYEEF